VAAAAWGFPVPFDTYGRGADVYVDGTVSGSDRQTVGVSFSAVDRGFFDALGTRLLAGRDFAAYDTAGAPGVVVVNGTMAERFWPGRDPLGQTVRLGRVDGRALRVIGVVEDVVFRSPRMPPAPYMFLSMRQTETNGLTLVVHARDDAESMIPAVRGVIASVNPAVAAYGAISMRRGVRNALNLEESAAGIATVIGTLALLLAVIGLYGVVAYSVERRTREVGIRIALGASAQSVWRLVLLRAGGTALAGIAVGLLAAAAAGRGLESLLFRVSTTDPVAFLGVPLVLLVVTLIASFIPARRAARVDPVVALRAE
jgi:predicted permease